MVWLFGGAVVNLGSKEDYEKFYVPIQVNGLLKHVCLLYDFNDF
jgi:hypothetical protein